MHYLLTRSDCNRFSFKPAVINTGEENMSELTKNKCKKILPKGVKDLYRLTPMQEGMFYVDMSGDKKSYVIQNFFLLSGDPDETRIQQVIELLLMRYETFRSNFLLMSNGIFQIITEKGADYHYHDLSDLDQEQKDAYISQVAEDEVNRGFDLRKDLLIRIKCFRLNPNMVKCVWTYHHLILDGWSLQNSINDFVRYYTVLSNGAKFGEVKCIVMRERESAPKFKDFVTWIYKQNKKNALAYWKKLLEGYENTAEIKPVMCREIAEPAVARNGIKLDKLLSGRVKQKFKNISLDIFLKVIWGITLQKYTLMQDVVFAEVVSCRNAELNEIEQMVGMLINVVPVRIKCDAECNFMEVLSEMHLQHINSFVHSFVPLPEIQMASGQKNELIKTLFVFENVDIIREASDTEVSMVCESIREQTNYGLSVICSADTEEIKFEMLYDSNLYSKDEIRIILAKVRSIINQVVESPYVRVSDIEMICEEEKQLIRNNFNRVEEYPLNETVGEIFESMARKNPDNTALYHEGHMLSYLQLNERANCVAHVIRGRGIRPGDLVAISTVKSLEMVIGILGIIKSGAAFLPIDATYPIKRMEYIIRDSVPKLFIKYKLKAKFDVPELDLESFEYRTEGYGNLDTVTGVDDLLYCIYTSGTTGEPKGVLVPHRGVPNLRNYFIRHQLVGDADRILQFASMSFDAMISELTMSLLTGASLYVPSDEMRYDGKILEKYMLDHRITIAIFPPLFLNQIHAEGLRTIITAGAETNRKIVSNHAHIKVYSNDYGPTEATVCATYWKHKAGDFVPERIPIGRPIPNAQVFIMSDMKLCGIGVPGEICIGGAGVAIGYLNRKDLTAEKFIKDPYGEGRLYRTGDIGRWLADGNIELIGRMDEQVKIRGFRIEPAEIEHVIRANADIKDIVVTVKESNDGDRFIVAYYTAEEEIKMDILKKRLENYLPEYMIPLRMIQMDVIPLTSNGKIDKNALPEVKIASEKEYEKPETNAEKALCRACTEVLGVEEIGIRDDFFELGGDSIKAIRIVSKMRTYGFEITVKNIMKRHTISAISSEAIMQEGKTCNRSLVEGKIIPTPMLNQFVKWKLAFPQCMTQHVMLQLDTDDVKYIQAALEALAKQHDMLRCTYHHGEFDIPNINESVLCSFRSVDITEPQDAAGIMEHECANEQNRFQLAIGPLLRAVLFRLEDENQLFLCIHHICVDAVSWQILIEDLNKALKQAKSGRAIDLGEKTISFQEWASLLAEYGKHIGDSEKNYWRKIEEESQGASLRRTKGPSRKEILHAELDTRYTEMLLRNTSKSYHTEINDLLICALGMAVHKTTGQSKVLVGLESHGREQITGNIAIDRTVGWFTNKFPVIVKCMDDIRDNLIQVKEMLRGVPMQGIGYGVIKGDFEELNDCIGFNYLGETDTENRRKMSLNKIGKMAESGNNLTGLLDMNCYIERQRFYLNCGIAPGKIQQADAELLIDSYMESLKLIILHCSSKTLPEKTVSDYSAVRLSETDLNRIYDNIGVHEADDIFGLTPQQEGMLYHAVADEGSTAYTVQNIFRLDNSIREGTIGKALDLLALKHELIRAGIQYRNTSSPWLVILKDRRIEYELIEMDATPEEENKISFQIGYDEIARGFDLERDSLIRVKCICLGERGWRLIWTYHHIIIDGWCASVLFGDFLDYCTEIENGAETDRIKREIISDGYVRGRYSDYVKWFQNDKRNILNYWSQYLKGYERTAEIKPMYRPRQADEQICRESMKVRGYEYAKIRDLVNELKITTNTVIETAVGIMLWQYNNTDDVVFGKVVSGRNADIKDVENIVGLFINTIPVRVSGSGETVISLLKVMQENGIASVENSRCSLSEIQGGAECSGELVKVLFAFENYYVNEERMNAFHFTIEQSREQTHYPITIVSYVENNELILEILYNPGQYHNEEISLILKRIAGVIFWMCENKESEAKKAETITPKEKELILTQFNDTEIEYPKESTIIDLFEKCVKKNPLGTAIIDGNRKLTYDEMNRNINQLALKLRGLGVSRDDFVAIISKRSIEMVLGIYAVIKSGGAYVPIDPDYPLQRKEFILGDCKPRAVLVFGSTIDVDIPIIDLSKDDVWSGPIENLTPINLPDDLAYTIYTSGTTGEPKGVMIRHSGVVAMNSYMQKLYKPGVGDRVLQYANYVFDASVWEMTMAFLNGAALLIISDEIIADAVLFKEYIATYNMTITLLPPQFLFQLPDISCRILTTGGSASNVDVVKKASFCQRYINAYGPTENTVLAAHWERNDKNQIYNSIPIGKPISNTRIYIMNYQGLCGIGLPGEICIAGAGLAKGYLNNQKLTDEKFGYHELTGERIYHTGDLARWLPDGNIEYLGRIDEQVKIRGYRIEVGEIECAIRSVDGIKDAVVSIYMTGGDTTLCAYYTTDQKIETYKLKNEIGKMLPSYMIPPDFVKMDYLPVTPSGKVDKKKLPAPDRDMIREKTNYISAQNQLEKDITDIWVQILNHEEIGIRDNFFDLGGNSLLVMSMQLKLNQRFHHNIKVADIFSHPTIESLACFISLKDNRVNCEEMLFHENYFRTIGEKSMVGSVRNCFGAAESRTIKNMMMTDENKLHSLFLFVYAYVMHLETNADELSITHLNQQEISAFKVSVPPGIDLNEFRKTIWEAYVRSLKTVDTGIVFITHPNALSAAFCYPSGSNVMKRKIFDFCISVGREGSDIYAEAEIFSSRTSDTGVKSFLDCFMRTVKTLLANI